LFLGLVISRPWLRYIDRKVVHFFYFYILWVTIQFAFKTPLWLNEGLSSSELFSKYLHAYVEPFGTLWFIYMLPVFFIITRLLKSVPWWVMLLGAALLQIAPISTGFLLLDEFASRYVFFLIGYLGASQIFNIARWVRGNVSLSAALLLTWAVVNGLVVFAPIPEFIATALPIKSLADLPVLNLMLGCLGALAIITVSTLLSQIRWAKPLEYLGKNSIVIYLAFFLPMAVSRIILLKFTPALDIGSISALVTTAGVLGPVVLYLIIQKIGWGKFLFERPQWAKLEKGSPTKAKLHTEEISDQRLHPAE